MELSYLSHKTSIYLLIFMSSYSCSSPCFLVKWTWSHVTNLSHDNKDVKMATSMKHEDEAVQTFENSSFWWNWRQNGDLSMKISKLGSPFRDKIGSFISWVRHFQRGASNQIITVLSTFVAGFAALEPGFGSFVSWNIPQFQRYLRDTDIC